ncbi:Uncharacterised protein [Mycobacteroides abscessus subsp. massiliense]|nr:Uncharacterised protein [Mycobacteroides abscessus subsp. massiliense]SLD41672.1 Uncharacterised protein [Mycobacteroides abscessus subsp. massiliense]
MAYEMSGLVARRRYETGNRVSQTVLRAGFQEGWMAQVRVGLECVQKGFSSTPYGTHAPRK